MKTAGLCWIAALAAPLLAAGGAAFTPGQILTLEQAYDRTLATDQSIRIAWLELRKANLLPWSALTRLGPQLTGNVVHDNNYSRSFETIVDPTGPVIAAGNSTTSNITLQQPLFDLTVFPAYRVGSLTARATRLQYVFTVRQTLFGVASAYYEVLKQESVVAVNQETFDLAGQQLHLAQERHDVGDAARSDVLRAQATLEGARQTLITAQNALDVDRNTLSNILNLGGDTSFHLAEPPDAPTVVVPLETALALAFSRREDYKASAIAVEEDVQRRKEILAEYAPKIVAQTSADSGRATQTEGGTGSTNTSSWDANVAVQIPFLTGGQREIDLRTAGHQINETRLNYETAGKNLQEEVKNAWLEVRTLSETLKAARAQVEASSQTYIDVENQYKEGSATSLDAQSALIDLNNSRTTLSTETSDYQVALRDLQRSMALFEETRVENAMAAK